MQQTFLGEASVTRHDLGGKPQVRISSGSRAQHSDSVARPHLLPMPSL